MLLVAGGAAGARTLRGIVRSARAQQRQLTADVAAKQPRGAGGAAGAKKAKKVAVDGVFFARLMTILRM